MNSWYGVALYRYPPRNVSVESLPPGLYYSWHRGDRMAMALRAPDRALTPLLRQTQKALARGGRVWFVTGNGAVEQHSGSLRTLPPSPITADSAAHAWEDSFVEAISCWGTLHRVLAPGRAVSNYEAAFVYRVDAATTPVRRNDFAICGGKENGL